MLYRENTFQPVTLDTNNDFVFGSDSLYFRLNVFFQLTNIRIINILILNKTLFKKINFADKPRHFPVSLNASLPSTRC